MKYMAVVPARAGSVTVKNKNTRSLGRYPLFAWSIKHALESDRVGKVALSTNDPVAKNLCQQLFKDESKVEVIDRPDDISTGTSASEHALIHAVQGQKDKPEFVMMLQPTSPFRFNNLVDKCISHLEDNEADSLLTGLPLHDFFWFRENPNEWISSYDIEKRQMRQTEAISDVKYFDAGNIYVTKTDALLNTECRSCNPVTVYPISHLESIQIDTEEEFRHCEIIIKGLKGGDHELYAM